MTRDEIVAAIRKNADAIRGKGVAKLAIFGSRAGNDYRPDSDIDVLVEIEPGTSFSLLNLIDVEHIIEDATGLQAQATVRRSISPRFAERIADDIVEIF
ncbi:nucleotidyltransferase domain-containing protein [Bradyrhizobium sp. IC3069]|uniref:Nucleotidyltransferase n=1 Tax=Bradyrhizobium yuanmingense TaxID=108015 RepID=A0ABV4G928_9BRAD|nr:MULTISPECIES: nucleotidyltransferase domain-containing protein [Bradyrhizobium]MCA1359555.1 nucleotidyltransferase domain-containing protein [Bradyrhizobium sp. IC4059]MCA1390982.1 nucleotidyltransferase domain-containing protein [Bradyrhizobium sp. IC3123]MCA1416470.1 nucleotidyltransferase domain-containing protein [Bradyrhizobium sp. NBAIM20]MCA1465404.1 nucleotidyltransferase domain-containing protein [Bradyrhizobium sp. NBAIM18]MCA1519205.1 nucleotidyltransferase domain-containing prot